MSRHTNHARSTRTPKRSAAEMMDMDAPEFGIDPPLDEAAQGVAIAATAAAVISSKEPQPTAKRGRPKVSTAASVSTAGTASSTRSHLPAPSSSVPQTTVAATATATTTSEGISSSGGGVITSDCPAIRSAAPHPAHHQQQIPHHHPASLPLNVQLLSCFGGFPPVMLHTLENFFALSLRYAREDVIGALLALSHGMASAVETHTLVKNDLMSVNARAERIFESYQASERLCEELQSKFGAMKESIEALEKEKAVLQEQLKIASSKISTAEGDKLKAENELKSKENELSTLKNTLETLSTSKASEIQRLEEKHAKHECDLGLQIKALEAELAESKKDSERFAGMVSKFTDPVTNKQHRCPVIQTNGVIRSLDGIIRIWLGESNMGHSNAFRMFQCPVLHNFTMISPFSIVDAFLNLAQSMAVDISPPMTFVFKDSGDSWVEFSFHEQLELIARLCDVYNQRADAAKPPEQRNVSVNGMSFLISMRAIAQGGGKGGGKGKKYGLECFGINNSGGGKIDIKVSFSPGWTHPFVDMVF